MNNMERDFFVSGEDVALPGKQGMTGIVTCLGEDRSPGLYISDVERQPVALIEPPGV